MAGGRRLKVPNPKKPARGRLDAPPTRVVESGKRYRRRRKHRLRDEEV